MGKRIQCKCCGAVRIVSKTSKFMGVDYHKRTGKYRVRVTDNNNQTKHIGYYDTELDASIAYESYIVSHKIVNRQLNYGSF